MKRMFSTPMVFNSCLIFLLCIASGSTTSKGAGIVVVEAANTTGWEGRRIYQIMTDRFAQTSYNPHAPCSMNQYCGGTFAGAEGQLDYIAGMGFDAIWISPVPVNYHLGYHGYWATDFFKINPHFGTPVDLTNFVDAAHKRGIWIMIDIVMNHVGPVGNDFSNVYPFNKSEHYHQDCPVTQYTCETQMIQNCRLANLPDLNQRNPFVKDQLQKYLLWLINDFKFDGIRADTVMYIQNSYWQGLTTALGGTGDGGTYMVGEVESSFNCNKNYVSSGAVDATLNYPLFYTMRTVFQSGSGSNSMVNLGNYWRQQATLPRPNAEVNFLDNQDNSRFLTGRGTSIPLYRSALVHMYFTNGIPCVYYGTEQLYKGSINGNENRTPLWWSKFNNETKMYNFLKVLNLIHKSHEVWTHPVEERWSDATLYCFARGQLLVCTTNQVWPQTRTLSFMPWVAGTRVCDAQLAAAEGSQQHCYTAQSSMTITVPAGGEPLVLAPV